MKTDTQKELAVKQIIESHDEFERMQIQELIPLRIYRIVPGKNL